MITVWSGPVSFAHWMENTQKAVSDPEFGSTNMQIVDLRYAKIDEGVDEMTYIKNIIAGDLN